MVKTNYNRVNDQLNRGYKPKTFDGFVNLYKELHDHLSVEIIGNFRNYFYVVAYHRLFDRVIMAKEFWSIEDLKGGIGHFEELALDIYTMKQNFKANPSIDSEYRQRINDKGTVEYRKQYYRETRAHTDDMAFYQEHKDMIKEWIKGVNHDKTKT